MQPVEEKVTKHSVPQPKVIVEDPVGDPPDLSVRDDSDAVNQKSSDQSALQGPLTRSRAKGIGMVINSKVAQISGNFIGPIWTFGRNAYCTCWEQVTTSWSKVPLVYH